MHRALNFCAFSTHLRAEESCSPAASLCVLSHLGAKARGVPVPRQEKISVVVVAEAAVGGVHRHLSES